MLAEMLEAQKDRWTWTEALQRTPDPDGVDEVADADFRAEDLTDVAWHRAGRDLYTGRRYFTPTEKKERA